MNRLLAIAAIPFLGLVAGGHASAEAIHACVTKKGLLRIVEGPGECARREAPLSWSSQGPRGEPGPEGPEGLPGRSLAVFDANDREIGLLVGFTPSSISPAGLFLYRATEPSVRATEVFLSDLGLDAPFPAPLYVGPSQPR